MNVRLFFTLVAASLAIPCCDAMSAEPVPEELALVGRLPVSASFEGCAPDGRLRFVTDDGKSQLVESSELVRWSNPAMPRASGQATLTDGSELMLADSWSDGDAVTFEDDAVQFETRSLGRLSVSRSNVTAIFWQLPADLVRRSEIAGQLSTPAEGAGDVLMFANGDLATGRFVGIEAKRREGGAAKGGAIRFDAAVGGIEAPLERVAGVRFRPEQKADDFLDRIRLRVGLRDGSIIGADTIAADEGQLLLRNASVGAVRCDLGDIVYLQGHGDRIAYLSDVAVSGYRHVPYLSMEWPYRMDANLFGHPLQAAGRRYLKGLAMHSASTATFAAPEGYRRFAALVAIEDSAQGGGSVTFRVVLRRGDQWREAFSSPTVPGAMPPAPVSVDVGDAEELALIVDFADRGEELDRAVWLDARFERE